MHLPLKPMNKNWRVRCKKRRLLRWSHCRLLQEACASCLESRAVLNETVSAFQFPG